jgi:hypothetical protein
MDAAPETSESLAENPDRDLPPLRLVHLLLYLVVASVYLTMAMSWRWNPSEDLRAAADGRYWQIISTPPALWKAATTTIVILLFVWTCQRRRVWCEPGHWLALYFVWNGIAPAIGNHLFQMVRILSGTGLKDDWSHFWPWAKSVHGIPHLIPAIISIALAFGWRRVANTWLWRIYFALVGIMLLSGVVSNLPYDWGNRLRVAWPTYDYIMGVVWMWQPRILIGAVINDLLPGRPRRHWSHWVPSVQSLLASYYAPIPNIVWNLRNPLHQLPWN